MVQGFAAHTEGAIIQLNYTQFQIQITIFSLNWIKNAPQFIFEQLGLTFSTSRYAILDILLTEIIILLLHNKIPS